MRAGGRIRRGVPVDINSWSNCVYPNRRRGGLLPVIIFVTKCNCVQAGQSIDYLKMISHIGYRVWLKIFAGIRSRLRFHSID